MSAAEGLAGWSREYQFVTSVIREVLTHHGDNPFRKPDGAATSAGLGGDDCGGDVIAGWYEYDGEVQLLVFGCTLGHVEVGGTGESRGRQPCWNCWGRRADSRWGSAGGHFGDGGYCSGNCRREDLPLRLVRLGFQMVGAAGGRRYELLRRLIEELTDLLPASVDE